MLVQDIFIHHSRAVMEGLVSVADEVMNMAQMDTGLRVDKSVNNATRKDNDDDRLYSAVLRSRADSLRSHVILHELLAF